MNAAATIKRWCRGPNATFGTFRSARGFECYTIERPWLDNIPFKSCIPTGAYEIRRDDFKGKYPDYRLYGVPGRTDIEMHRANIAEELQGCIAPGLTLGVHKGSWAVMSSRRPLSEWWKNWTARRPLLKDPST